MQTALIEDTVRRFVADPAQAESTPAVTAHVENGTAELSAGSFSWETDLPPSLGGGNGAPSPVAYLLGALAGCAAALMRDTLAPQLGVAVGSVTAVARCRSDARGLLGMPGARPDLDDLELEVTVESREPAERLDPLFRAWRERCPVYLALGGADAVSATFVTRSEPAPAPTRKAG